MRKYRTKEQRLIELQEFTKTYNRLPLRNAKDDDERSLAKWITGMKNTEQWQPVIDICNTFEPLCKSREQRLEELQEFTKTYNRLPKNNAKDDDERSLAMWIENIKYKEQWQPLIDICNNFDPLRKTKEQRLEELQEFIRIHNRLPLRSTEDEKEKSLAGWVTNMRTVKYWQPVIDIYNAFDPSRKTKEQRLKDLQEFVKTYNRLPKISVEDEKSLADWVNRMKNGEQWQPVIEICDAFDPLHKSKEQRLIELQEFIRVHNRLPLRNAKDENSLARWVSNKKYREQWKPLIVFLKIARAAIMGNEVAKKLLTYYQRS